MESIKILIADDSKINRELLSIAFEGKYEIYKAADGQQTLDMIEEIPDISLLLLDLYMPKKNGFEVLDVLRERGLLQQLPVIVVTSSMEEEDEVLAFQKGAAEIVRKPFIPEKILRRADNLIELYRSRNDLRYQLLQRTDELAASKKYDLLTGFLNMNEFLTSADRILEEAGETARQEYGFVFTNVRNFSHYNVHHGMKQGDLVLQNLAKEMQELPDGVLFCRYGQDHFVILVRSSEEQIAANTQYLHRYFQTTYGKFGMYFKMGFYHVGTQGETAHTACELAKLACDSIRDKKAFYCEYDETLRHSYERRNYVIQHLEEAMQEHYIQVYYQPIMRTINGKVCGLEALARWIDPKHGFLSPAEFIPVLEENRLITKLDLYVIRQVCEDTNARKHVGMPVVPISLNLSRVDFQECDMLAEVEWIVRETGVPRDLLNFEITETAIMSDPEALKIAINCFREAGYQVWMDDFGSGYSSLNVLKDYPFDEIKLDMKFMASFDEKTKNIITSVIDMAKSIGMQTLAEGVETQEQYDFLRNIGCEKVQGYLLSRPLCKEEMRKHPLTQIENLELRIWEDYYRKIGAVRFITEWPLALIEWDGENFRYLYFNRRYEAAMISTGVADMEEACANMNRESSPVSQLFREFIDTCHVGDGPTELIYSIRDCHIRVITECIAEHKNRSTYQTTVVNLSGLETELQRTRLHPDTDQSFAFFDSVFLADRFEKKE